MVLAALVKSVTLSLTPALSVHPIVLLHKSQRTSHTRQPGNPKKKYHLDFHIQSTNPEAHPGLPRER